MVGLLFLLSSTLTACVTPSGPPLDGSAINSRITDPAARRQLQQGNPVAAADIYSKRAARSKSLEEQQNFLLLAAEILYDRSMAEPGLARLQLVPEQLITLGLSQRRDILKAKSLIYDAKPDEALLALPDPTIVDDPFHRGRVFETRAQAYNMLQDPDNELIARLALEQQLSDPAIIERSHEKIWLLLNTQPLSTLHRMTTNVRGDVYQGWIELALTHASSGADPQKQRAGLSDWQQRFSSHPANVRFVQALYAPTGFDMQVDGKPINQLAILLPLSGKRTATVSAAIRDGIIAAHDQSKSRQQVPVLRFYDVGDNPGYVRTAYKNAIANGADAVIGPLRKEAVAAIISQRSVPVPTITLNTVEASALGGSTKNIIQFGLAPEDEARAAASRAAGLNLKNAIILQADDSIGDRETRAFQNAMFLYGGDVVHVAVLPKDQYDYSKQIKEALGIDKSDQRFRQLSRTIGEKLFFEPAIRNDVDVIFLAITTEQARSVRPQLDFFHARGVTRLGTSRIAAHNDDARENKDLNTIFYPDVPWILRKSMRDNPLRKQILNTFPNAEGAYAKLYALGADAYQMVTGLDALSQGKRLQGFTGALELTPQGRIQRHLDWAQYVEGVSQPVKNVEAPAIPSIGVGINN